MKKFIINCTLFIIPIILISLPLDFYYSNKLKNTNECTGEFEVWNDIFDENINCEIAIYGSSRAWVHINPDIVEDSLNLKTYNFGIDGHNFWLQNLRHQKIMKNNKKPQLIIYSVDIFTLQKRKELFNMNQFMPYMLWDFEIYNSTKSYVGFSILDYFIPILRFRHRSDIFTSKQTSIHPFRNKGFKGMEKEWNNDLDNARKITNSYTITLDTTSVKLFNNFIKTCKSENIDIILVYTPEYIEGQEYVSNRSDIIGLYTKLARSNDLLFFDYSDSDLCKDKKYFYNSSHLNAIGADIFSKTFISDLKKARTYNIKYKFLGVQ
jgi:hypothetical protein